MTTSLKVVKVGNSLGVILPKELLSKLNVVSGDKLTVVEAKNGVNLTPYDGEFEKDMEIVERIMREDRDVLKKLAE